MNEHVTIMVVEADRATAALHERHFEQQHLSTIVVADTDNALALGQRFRPDGVVCSANARPTGGADFCRAWCRQADTPVLVYTSQYDAAEADAVRAAGAADYVTQSITPEELVARVRTMLRQRASRLENVYNVGDLCIDTASCDVRLAGRNIRTTATEFRILHGLARSPGRVFSRDRIAYFAGTANSDAMERTIDAHIKNIRRKLGPSAPLLQTVRGFGYRVSDRPEDAGV